ncbi:MAG: DUF433 domain-containing protein [Candidatus Kariarchaeaceae archaeon]
MSEFDHIATNPKICKGVPCIKGTRVMVSVILDCLAEGMTEEEILEEYPTLDVGDVSTALRFAAWKINTRN